jgi:hypothetical protein
VRWCAVVCVCGLCLFFFWIECVCVCLVELVLIIIRCVVCFFCFFFYFVLSFISVYSPVPFSFFSPLSVVQVRQRIEEHEQANTTEKKNAVVAAQGQVALEDRLRRAADIWKETEHVLMTARLEREVELERELAEREVG